MAEFNLELFFNSHEVVGTLADKGQQIWNIANDCANYKINWSNTCDIPANIDTGGTNEAYLYFNFNLPEYRDTLEGEENGNGEVIYTYKRQQIILSTTVIMNDFWLDTLKKVMFYDTIQIQPVNPAGILVDMIDFTVEPQGDDGELNHVVRVSFRIKDSDRVHLSCCGSLYEDAPYDDPCTGEGGGGGGGEEDPCVDFDVTIDYDSGGPDLTANPTGGPPGAMPAYDWYFRPYGSTIFTKLSETAQSLNLTNPGTYRVVVTQGTCRKEKDFEYSADCTGFAVTITEINGALVASSNRIATFQWQIDTGGGYSDIGGATSPIYVPTEDADYKVIATSGSCTDEDEITFDFPECTWNATISNNGTEVEISVTGNTGTPTFQWFKDIGDGSGLTSAAGETNDSILITEPALYRVEVTADGCTKYFQIPVLDACASFQAFISGVLPGVPTPSEVRLTASAVNAPGPVVYTWYQFIGGAWIAQGTGSQIDLSTVGNVMLEAVSGDCKKTDEARFCIDPASTPPYERFVGTGSELEFVVNNFTLPDPGTYSDIEINSMIQVFRGHTKMTYGITGRHGFTIDIGTNKIVFNSGWPALNNELVEVIGVNI